MKDSLKNPAENSKQRKPKSPPFLGDFWFVFLLLFGLVLALPLLISFSV